MDIKKLIISISICQLAGLIGSIFTNSAIPVWYSFLNKPSFNPPNWIFGPVWLTLYTLMGVSLYIVWRHGLENKWINFSFWFFIAHLFINMLWSVFFFSLHNIGGSFGIIIILLAMIVALIKMFWLIDRWASYLLLPYLAWVSFAAILNYYIWILN